MLTVVQERWIETLIVSIFLVLNIAFSQESILYHVPPENVSSGESVKIIVSLFSDSRVLESKLFIRSTNSLNYIEEDLSFNGSSWQYDIPGDRITQVGLEYAIVFRLDDGSTLAFPRGDPLKNPFNLVIGPPKKRTRSFERRKSYFQDSKDFQTKDFLVLSPEPGSTIPPGDELIAVSFFNIPDIDTTSIKITIDGQDLTSLASIGGGIISLIPGVQDPGPHSIIVESMTKYDQPIRPLSWMFNTGKGEWSIMDEISYSGKVDGRASAQASGEQIVSYSEINGKFNLDLKWAGFKGTTRLNTRDSPFAQPLNRFSGNIYFGKYLNLYTGDFYPSLSQFTIDGRRVRGMGIDLDLKWLKVQSVRGELNSPVQRLGGVDGGLLLMNNETSIDSATGNPIFFLERTGYTFKRNISAMRFSGELFSRFKFGLHYLKAKDDIGSIDLAIDDYGTFNVDSSAYAGLSMDMSTGNYTYDEFLQVS